MNGEKPREINFEENLSREVPDEINFGKDPIREIPNEIKTTPEDLEKSLETPEEKLEKQKRTLEKLSRSGLTFLIFGGWSGKIQEVPGYGEDYYPRDIDIFVQLKDWESWFGQNNFSVKKLEDKLEVTDEETGAKLDVHLIEESPEKDRWIENTSRDTFYFPKEGFTTMLFQDMQVKVISPELWYHIEKGGPHRKEKQKVLTKLDKVVNSRILEELEKKFQHKKKTKNNS